MATKTFGKRNALEPAMAVQPQAATAVALADQPSPLQGAMRQLDAAFPQKDPLAFIPLLTLGMIVFLLFIFGVQRRLAFDIGKDGELSLESLLSLGAISYDLALGGAEIWRATLAPLLHSSYSHLIGNAFALFFVGMRLEPMIGRGWFAAIFTLSALGGVIGSLAGNPHGMPTVGASGAITGLIGALFAVSFNHRADPFEKKAMRKTALFFGLPALLPLAFGASGGTDYFAHAGGAIAGIAAGLALCLVWSEDGFRPDFSKQAIYAALGGLALSALSAGFAAAHYKTYAAKAALLIPSDAMPDKMIGDAKTSADLLSRYPTDPRAHIVRAIYLADKAHSLAGAESELRAAMALAGADSAMRPLRDVSQAVLAAVLKEMGRGAEAKTMAADMCRSKDQAGVRSVLVKEKLCD